MISLPRFYPILDASCFSSPDALFAAAEELIAADVLILQYRNKSGDAHIVLAQARELRRLSRTRPFALHKLIMNDRADLCLAAEFDGVHVGQDDLSLESVRNSIGTHRWLGGSTHNNQQVCEADKTSADYIAIGPV